MRIIITGTPGTGKTAIAKRLGQALGFMVRNEKEFALAEGIGEFDAAENELVVPLEKLRARLNKFLAKHDNVIVEGHLLCEIRARAADAVVLLTCGDPERLASRLELRGYNEAKIQDNVFCEGISYCKKHCLRNYPKDKVIEAGSGKDIKETLYDIIVKLRRLMKAKHGKPQKIQRRKTVSKRHLKKKKAARA